MRLTGIPLSLKSKTGALSSKLLIPIAKDESGCLDFPFLSDSLGLFVVVKDIYYSVQGGPRCDLFHDKCSSALAERFHLRRAQLNLGSR